MICRDYCEGDVRNYDKVVAYDSCSYTLTKIGRDKVNYLWFTNEPENTLNLAKIDHFKGKMYLLYKIKTKTDTKDLCHELVKNFGFSKNKFLTPISKCNKSPYYIYALVRNQYC